MAMLVPEGKDKDLITDCTVLLCKGVHMLLVFLGEVHNTQDDERQVAEMLLETSAALLLQYRDQTFTSLSGRDKRKSFG